MERSKRYQCILFSFVIAISVVLSGCASTPTRTDYYISSKIVADTPEDVTILDSENATILDNSHLHNAVKGAFENGNSTVEVNESTYNQTQDTLDQLPTSTVSIHGNNKEVIYVSNSSTIVVVYLSTEIAV